MSASKARGIVELKVPGGKTYKMALTLGAMAEIEDVLEIQSMVDIENRFQNPSVRDLIKLMVALLHGGGEDITDEELHSWPLDVKGYMKAVQSCFKVAGLDDKDGAPAPGN